MCPCRSTVNAPGFVLGEGAAFVVLEQSAGRAGAGAQCLGASSGTHRPRIPRHSSADSAAETPSRKTIAVRWPARRSRPGTSTRSARQLTAATSRDHEEAAALARVFGVAADPAGRHGDQVGDRRDARRVRTAAGHRDARSDDGDSACPGFAGCATGATAMAAGSLSATPRSLHIRTALVMAVSPDGCCCALVSVRPEARP